MLKIIKKIALPLCLALSVFLLTAGSIWSKRGSDFFNSLTILSEEGFESGLMKSAAQNLQARDSSREETGETDFTFTAWTELRNESVSDSFSKKKYNADITAICGSSGCLLPFGKNLSSQDTKGCIIGSKMAEKLFGGYMAEGQEIVWRDRTWTVRGVGRNRLIF